MKLHEYEAKEILKQYGIPTPKGFLAASVEETSEAVEYIGKPAVIKSQVLFSGRGKEGGILFVSSVAEAEKTAEKLLHTKIKGTAVKKVLVEEKILTKNELFLGLTIDRFSRSYVIISSPFGGMEIEDLALKSSERILKTKVDSKLGFSSFQARKIVKKMGYMGKKRLELARIIETMYQIAMDYDALLLEINPLAEMVYGEFIALDARIIIDDNALFRHPEFKNRILEIIQSLSPQEIQALESKIDFVKLDGNIGVAGNGAGLVMATLDMIRYYKGKPANFLDLRGGANAERTKAALKILLLDPDVDVIILNILGGITHCDEVARAIVEIKELVHTKKPLIIRLLGTNEEEGRHILKEAGFKTFESMEEAVEKVVELAKKGARFNGHTS
ncbi:MAG: ADP-forming succinate--CoA ligase subunit beta [Candidatus Bathyarchaeota archaeon]|nr:ADP-forming succinate--CoA ligase subunit beta [Candidatus Bathyarchaeota archaeon]